MKDSGVIWFVLRLVVALLALFFAFGWVASKIGLVVIVTITVTFGRAFLAVIATVLGFFQ